MCVCKYIDIYMWYIDIYIICIYTHLRTFKVGYTQMYSMCVNLMC